VNSETPIIDETALRRERGGDAKLSRDICPRPDRGRGEDIATITCNAEPSLDELLRDDTVRLLMAADGVQEGALRALLGVVKKARQNADPILTKRALPVDARSETTGTL
jgi:hypothetical protein